MTRTSFRRVWVVGIFLLLSAAVYMYRAGEDYQKEISQASTKREQLIRDLRASNQLSAALVDLDNFTIDEQGITRLDLLKHLNLQESSLQFKPGRRSEKKIGTTTLYMREFTLSGTLPYAAALEQLDALYNTKKVVLDRMELAAGRGFGDAIEFDVTGTLYGLEKK